MPCAAHNGNTLVASLGRLAYALAHMGLAQGFALHIGLAAPMLSILRQLTAHSRHGFVDGFKQRLAIPTLFH